MQQTQIDKYGDWFTYNKTSRAVMFRELTPLVDEHGLQGMRSVMRYNNYQHDPAAACDCSPPYSAENGVSARNDLNPSTGTYAFSTLGHRPHGGIDSKITSFDLASTLSATIIAGPTYDDLPPFSWSSAEEDIKSLPHLGIPDSLKFPWVDVAWDHHGKKL